MYPNQLYWRIFLIFVGSAAYKKLRDKLTRPRLVTAICKLSNYHQTSTLEAKHSLDNQFAPKKIYYPYHSLMARFVSNEEGGGKYDSMT